MFGDKRFPGAGYPAPDDIPTETSCLLLQIPADASWWGIMTGLLTTLSMEWSWQQFEGSLDRDLVAARWQEMVEDALELAATTSTCPPTAVPTPFWDDASDTDDEAEPDVQTWYGSVDDPEAAPEELTFVENAAIWAFTGFLAVATLEVGAAPAVLFHTIAPRFVLATRRGDLAGIIRILIDGEDAAYVDTTDYSAGDIVRIPIDAGESETGHDIMLIEVEG